MLCPGAGAICERSDTDVAVSEVIEAGFSQLSEMTGVVMFGQDETSGGVIENCDCAYILTNAPEV